MITRIVRQGSFLRLSSPDPTMVGGVSTSQTSIGRLRLATGEEIADVFPEGIDHAGQWELSDGPACSISGGRPCYILTPLRSPSGPIQ